MTFAELKVWIAEAQGELRTCPPQFRASVQLRISELLKLKETMESTDMFGFTKREFTDDRTLAAFLRDHGAIDDCRKMGPSNQWHDAHGVIVIAVYSGEGGMTVTYWVRDGVKL